MRRRGLITTPPTFSNGVTLVSGNLIVPSGVSSFTITTPTIDDTLDESNELYNLTVGGVAATGGILDNDTASIASVTLLDRPYRRLVEGIGLRRLMVGSLVALPGALVLYGADGYHPSALGSYLVALTIYEKVIGKAVVLVTST
mgnify:CR=1 FL=1